MSAVGAQSIVVSRSAARCSLPAAKQTLHRPPVARYHLCANEPEAAGDLLDVCERRTFDLRCESLERADTRPVVPLLILAHHRTDRERGLQVEALPLTRPLAAPAPRHRSG
jgi:hypothetical protein